MSMSLYEPMNMNTTHPCQLLTLYTTEHDKFSVPYHLGAPIKASIQLHFKEGKLQQESFDKFNDVLEEQDYTLIPEQFAPKSFFLSDTFATNQGKNRLTVTTCPLAERVTAQTSHSYHIQTAVICLFLTTMYCIIQHFTDQ